MRHPALHGPLAWQYYFLAAICGLFAPIRFDCSFIVLLCLLYFNKSGDIIKNSAILGIFFLSFIFSAQHFRQLQLPPMPEWSYQKKLQTICGKVYSIQGLPDKRARVILENIQPAGVPDSPPLAGLCAWTWENAPLAWPLPGQSVCMTRPLLHAAGFANSMENPPRFRNPEIFWRIWSDNDRGKPLVSGKPFWWAVLRQDVFIKFLSALTDTKIDRESRSLPRLNQSQAILVALLFGDRRFLSQKTVDSFANASLAHSLALSGQHLGVAVAIGFILIVGLAKIFPTIYLRQPRAILAGLISLPIALLYLWIGGAPPSLLRAGGMLFFFVWLSCRRRVHALSDLLFLALLAILLFNPFAIFDPGLQMSALCLAVICLAAPLLKRIHNVHNAPNWQKNLIQIFLLSLIIQLALLPLELSRFQQSGLWFPMNLLWLPLLGMIVLPLAALGLILAILPGGLPHLVASVIFKLACLPADLLIFLLEKITAWGLFDLPVFLSPHWIIFLAFGLLIISGSKILSGGQNPDASSRKLLGAAILLLCVPPGLRVLNYLEDNFSIEALDVGQGQSLLINFPDNGKIIIDGGGSKSTRFDPGKNIVSPLLTDNAAPRLASVINTHPDLDHLGGLIFLIKKFHPDFLFHNGRPGNSTLGEIWQKYLEDRENNILASGDRLILGEPPEGLELEVLHPPKDDWQWKGNAASIVLRLTKNGKGLALFMGDAEKSALREIVKSGRDISAQVVFAPHHGSDKSLYGPFYDKARPELVVASCGYQNRWHYPGKNLTRFLEKKGVPLLDTGNAGRIQIEFGDKLKVKTAKKGNFTFGNGNNRQ